MASAVKKAIGLELDYGAARAVELSGSPQDSKLTVLGSVALPAGAVEEGMVINPELVGQALKKLWSSHGFSSRDVLLGVSNQGVLVRYATFPKVAPDKLDNVIRYQAQEHLPIALSSVVLDYLVVGETTGETGPLVEVLLVAARRDMLDKFIKALDYAGVEPGDIDVSTLTLTRVMPPVAGNMTVAMVDVANGLTNILITSNGIPRLARLVSAKVKDIADRLQCSLDEVFAGVNNSPEDTEDVISDWVKGLTADIHSSIMYYQGRAGSEGVEQVYLTGRGARLHGVAEQMAAELDLPVHTLNPLKNHADTARKNASAKGEELDYAVSVGLARRGLEG
jgi:type IV pilus assembly protein PilM